MLRVSEVVKVFTSEGGDVRAVDGISLEVSDGRFVSIVGPSGSGKSTLLALLGALDKPTSGRIEVDGRDVTGLSERQLIDYRRNTVGFVFQDYGLVPNLSALENVMLPMEFAGVGRQQRQERAAKLLGEVGITEGKLGRHPRRLSGGEQQRVSIARALANKPRLILADEPTGNLDSDTSEIIVGLLRDLAKAEGTIVIVVTHNHEIAKQTDLTFKLKDGKLVG